MSNLVAAPCPSTFFLCQSCTVRSSSVLTVSSSARAVQLPDCSFSIKSSRKFSHSRERRSQIRASTNDEQANATTTTSSDSEKEDLAAKLAAAEAEAEALKRELALRRGSGKEADLSKLKPATPEKRIDGTGFRETIFTVPSQGEKNQSPKKWGLTEAELFLSKGAPTEGMGLQGEAMEEGAENIVTRRLIGGIGLAAVALALAFVKLPATLSKPSKPLFFYVTYILRLKDSLETLEANGSDAKVVESELVRAYDSSEELKDNFLSAASLLEGSDADKATSLSYEIFDYLFQANSSKYFDQLGTPTPAQQAEFLKFSLLSIQAARSRIQEFLRLVPADAVDAAKLRLS